MSPPVTRSSRFRFLRVDVRCRVSRILFDSMSDSAPEAAPASRYIPPWKRRGNAPATVDDENASIDKNVQPQTSIDKEDSEEDAESPPKDSEPRYPHRCLEDYVVPSNVSLKVMAQTPLNFAKAIVACCKRFPNGAGIIFTRTG